MDCEEEDEKIVEKKKQMENWKEVDVAQKNK